MVYTLTVHMYAKDDAECIEKLKLKLIEAARVYRNDKETVDWFVMQDVKDPRAFTVVERFEQESVRPIPLCSPPSPLQLRHCYSELTRQPTLS